MQLVKGLFVESHLNSNILLAHFFLESFEAFGRLDCILFMLYVQIFLVTRHFLRMSMVEFTYPC